jgi:YidC/Oxa1 family membrane protein insertase
MFYAGSWIDETWVRSAALAARRSGMTVRLAVSSATDVHARAQMTAYAQAGISVHTQIDADRLRALRARVVVSATNGLRRELFHPDTRHVVHMPHSLVSLHMIYAADSFDGFDTLFACGPHHVAEFERLSVLRGLGGRRTRNVGYGKLDLLAAERVEPRHVLIAPSWGQTNILNTIGPELVEALLREGLRVTVRPHPLFVLDHDPAWLEIGERFAGREAFSTENPFEGDGAIRRAGVLVTDYSGTAFEHSALHGRRCVFVDVGKKVVNPDWESVGLAPVEVGLRPHLGIVVPAGMEQAREAVVACAAQAGVDREAVAARERFLFNPGACGPAAAAALSDLVVAERAA